MALILPLDATIPPIERGKADRDLHFTRLRARHRSQAVFIGIESIVRGALLAKDHAVNAGDEYLVIEPIDQDFWWRMKSLKLICRANL